MSGFRCEGCGHKYVKTVKMRCVFGIPVVPQTAKDVRHWATPNTEPYPHVAIGVLDSNQWYCGLMWSGTTIEARNRPSRRAAIAAVRRQARKLKGELGALKI